MAWPRPCRKLVAELCLGAFSPHFRGDVCGGPLARTSCVSLSLTLNAKAARGLLGAGQDGVGWSYQTGRSHGSRDPWQDHSVFSRAPSATVKSSGLWQVLIFESFLPLIKGPLKFFIHQVETAIIPWPPMVVAFCLSTDASSYQGAPSRDRHWCSLKRCHLRKILENTGQVECCGAVLL
jgi:hypothetical protein